MLFAKRMDRPPAAHARPPFATMLNPRLLTCLHLLQGMRMGSPLTPIVRLHPPEQE